MRILILLLLFTITIGSVNGQRNKTDKNNEFYANKREIGVNITNLLGNLLSLNPNNVNSPYFISFRQHFKKTSLRFGFNYDLDQTEEFEFLSNEAVNKKVKASVLDARIGMEWHYPISKRFMMSSGIDVIFSQFKDDSEISTSSFSSGSNVFKNFRSLETSRGFGGGPFIRFDFKFNDLISLSTESTFYYIYSKDSDQLFGDPGQLLSENNATKNSVALALPQALFVNISF